MHFFDFTPPSAPARLVRLAVCTLLPAFIQEAAAVGMQRPVLDRSTAVHVPPHSRPAPAPKSLPYLLVCLPPPLRFADPVEPADPVSGPPHPAGILEEIAAENHQAAMSAPVPAVSPSKTSTDSSENPPALATAASSVTQPSVPVDPAIPASPSPAPPRTGIAILPDDTPRAVRAEDVLIYFQFPPAPPATGLPPQSSATYRQQ